MPERLANASIALAVVVDVLSVIFGTASFEYPMGVAVGLFLAAFYVYLMDETAVLLP